MKRQTSRDSQATFNGSKYQARNTPSPQPDDPYFNQPKQQQKINLKDFETFEPREDAIDESSNASSILVPPEMQRRFEHDMHLMLDDLDMPNQSMTLSSLNHSQWHVRSNRSYLSSLSTNQVGLGGHQSSVESSQVPSARQLDTNSNLTMSNSHSQFGTEEKYSRHEDSPDFNRPQDLVSVTDELTVSKSDIERVTDYGGGKSYREHTLEAVQPPLIRNQNRTFADSVIDHHQINGLSNNLSQPQTSMKRESGSRFEQNKQRMALHQSKTVDTRSKFEGKNLSPYLESANTLDEPMLDQSEMSELDLLTRTQISHNLACIDPNARSRIFLPQLLQDDLSQSQITVPGSDPSLPPTQRNKNNIFQKMVDDASSLNFTPEKDSAGLSTNSINWQLKSHNANREIPDQSDTSQLNTDRADYMNPISQLKEKIKQSNIQKRLGSKGRDNELYEALEANPPPPLKNQQQFQRTIQDLQSQNQELNDQNRQLTKTCEVYAVQISELQKSSNQKVPSSNELLRVRALEAARAEIRELREQVEEKESRIILLEQSQLEMEKRVGQEKSGWTTKIDALELQIEKQKILIQGQKRESENSIGKASSELQDALNSVEHMRYEMEQSELRAQQKIKSIEYRFHSQEQQLQARDLELQSQEKKLKKLSTECVQIESHSHALEQELLEWKSKCAELEEEVDLVRQRNVGNHSLALATTKSSSGFDIELKRVKEKHQQQLTKLSDENFQLVQTLKEMDAKMKALEQNQLLNEELVIEQLQQMLSVNRSQVVSHISEMVANIQSLTLNVKQSQDLIQVRDSQIQHLQDKLKSLQSELAQTVDAVRKAQQAANSQESQIGPSNFTKNLLHQKDVDIQNLKEQLEQQQEMQWQLEQDLKLTQNALNQSGLEKHEMQSEIMQTRKAKQIAETNVAELKDKLRQELAKQHDHNLNSISQVQPSNEKQKYEEILNAVMALQLAEDPLTNVLTLQKSFCDEHEQALSHLQEQTHLVKNLVISQQKQIAMMKQQALDGQSIQEKVSRDLKQAVANREDIKSELVQMETASKRQAEIIAGLEKQLLQNQDSQFLSALDYIIDGGSTDQSDFDRQLLVELKQRVSKFTGNDLSQIIMEGGNPLQDKSGKHEAFLFLTHLRKTQDKDVQTDENFKDIIESLKIELNQKETALEMLHSQLMSELQLKTDEFEIESQQIQQERNKFQLQLEKVKQDYEKRLIQMQEQHEFRISELEIDYQSRIEQDSIVLSSARSQLKTEAQEKLSLLKLEEKRLKQEIERLKKVHSEKLKSLQTEFEQEKSVIKQQFQETLEESAQQSRLKTKESVDKAVTSIRSEMLNKMSELKNEHARAQAEFQRERSKFEQQKSEAIEDVKLQMNQDHAEALKEAKIVLERVCKKRLDEKQMKHDERLREIDNELEELKQSQREELRKQTKIWQQKLKEAENNIMPKQVTAAMTQVSPQPQKFEETPGPVTRQSPQSACSCSIEQNNLNQQQELFIEQLKINFEQELERQEDLHLQDLSQKLHQTITTLEQLILLEMEKILITIGFKSKESGIRTQSELNDKRKEINQLIKQLFQSQNKEQKDLKRSFESVKAKFSIVLATLKQQIENKYQNAKHQQTRSTIQIDDTESESGMISDNTTIRSSQQKQYESHRQQLVRQSTTSSADVNLTNNLEQSPRQFHQQRSFKELNRQSEIKNYIEYQEHLTFQDKNPMTRLAPQSQNSKGAVVVEVEKVVRDLQMLFDTTKMAKFCRVLLGPQADSSTADGSQSARSVDQSNVVNSYRDLLNNFFRLISKLNQASDQVCQDQEVFRLRLLNVDLKQQVSQLMKDQSGVVTRSLVQDVITFYQKQSQVVPKIKNVLEALEQLHFQISKNQFKLNQLADLFTKEGKVNENLREVVQKCEEFSTVDQFLESSFQNKYLAAEMMSPDETAHLIATVIQKLPGKTLSVSSEDILKQALQICQDQSTLSMPPLQRLPKAHRLGTTAQTINQPSSTIQTTTTGRSRSTGMQPNNFNMPRQTMLNSGSLYQTVEPVNRYLSQAEQKQMVINNEKHFTGQEPVIQMPSTNIIRGVAPMSQTFSQETDFLIEEGDSGGINNQQTSLDEELACAQTKVNQQFEKLKGSKFNTLQY